MLKDEVEKKSMEKKKKKLKSISQTCGSGHEFEIIL
jgi:hypothetical protein